MREEYSRSRRASRVGTAAVADVRAGGFGEDDIEVTGFLTRLGSASPIAVRDHIPETSYLSM